MEIKIKAYAYTIDIITEIRYFCKCNNAVFGKFRIIFTCTNPSKPAAKTKQAPSARCLQCLSYIYDYFLVAALRLEYSLNSVVLPVFLNAFILNE